MVYVGLAADHNSSALGSPAASVASAVEESMLPVVNGYQAFAMIAEVTQMT